MSKLAVFLRSLVGSSCRTYREFGFASIWMIMCFNSSTDSELKLWNVESGQCIRTYKGHTNEKNFVGLTVNKNFIACGKWRDFPLCTQHEDTAE